MMSANALLRHLQVALYVLTIIAGLMTSISLGWATKVFNLECPLHAEIHLQMATNNTYATEIVHYGSLVRCEYCTYTAVMAAIYAITWFWFYFLMSDFRDDDPERRTPPDTQLLLPSLVFNIVLCTCCFVLACIVSDGFSYFCHGIRTSLQKGCSAAGDYPWNLLGGQAVYEYLRVATAGAWILATTLAVKIVVVSVRIYRFVHQVSLDGSFSLASFSRNSRCQGTDPSEFSSSSDEDDDLDQIDNGMGFSNPNFREDLPSHHVFLGMKE